MPHPWINTIEAAPRHQRLRLAVDTARNHPDGIETAEALRAIFASPKPTYRRYAIHMAAATRDTRLLERACLDASERNGKLALRLRSRFGVDGPWQKTVEPALSDVLRAYLGRQTGAWRREWNANPDEALAAFRQANHTAEGTTQRQQLWARATPLLESLALTDPAAYWALFDKTRGETFVSGLPLHLRIARQKAPAAWHGYLAQQLARMQPSGKVVRWAANAPKRVVQRLPFALLLAVIANAGDAYVAVHTLVKKLRGYQKSALLSHWIEHDGWQYLVDPAVTAAFSPACVADARAAFADIAATAPWRLPASTDGIDAALQSADERLARVRDALHNDDADARAQAAAHYLRQLALHPDAWHRELPALLPRWTNERDPTRALLFSTLRSVLDGGESPTRHAHLTTAPTFDPLLRFITQSLRAPDVSSYTKSLGFGLFLTLFASQPDERPRLLHLLAAQHRVLLPQDTDGWSAMSRSLSQPLAADALEAFVPALLDLSLAGTSSDDSATPFHRVFEVERVRFAAQLAGPRLVSSDRLVHALARQSDDVIAGVLRQRWYDGVIPVDVARALLLSNPALRRLPPLFAATLDLDDPADVAALAPVVGRSPLLDDASVRVALATRGVLQTARAAVQERLLDALRRPVDDRDAFEWRLALAATVPEATVGLLIDLQAHVPTIRDEDDQPQPLSTQAVFQALRTVDQRDGALTAMVQLDATALPRVGRPFLRRAHARALRAEKAALSPAYTALVQRAIATKPQAHVEDTTPLAFFDPPLPSASLHALSPDEARSAVRTATAQLRGTLQQWDDQPDAAAFRSTRALLDAFQVLVTHCEASVVLHPHLTALVLRPLADALLDDPRTDMQLMGLRVLLRTVPDSVDEAVATIERALGHFVDGPRATIAFTLCLDSLGEAHSPERAQRATVLALAGSPLTASRLLAATLLYRTAIGDEDADARRMVMALQHDSDDAVRALALLTGMSRTPW